MSNSISVNGHKGGSSLLTWGVFVSIVAVLLMVVFTMFFQNSLTSLSLTLISGLLTFLAVMALSQVIKKAFTSP
jgi:hypothetical protein